MSYHDEAAGQAARNPVAEPAPDQARAQVAAPQSGAETDDPSELRRALLVYGTAGNPVRNGGAAQA
ncbi:hypothetical protein [uncultured Massilia sp.]|uniref:hypothetical protein n=1 Tax=uncultured Massilia sp. TaxID=169973 RepID=UPI0025D2F805|nr:hypothetical protein [uncultured Massilia sp.]